MAAPDANANKRAVVNPEAVQCRHREIGTDKSARLETKSWMLARLSVLIPANFLQANSWPKDPLRKRWRGSDSSESFGMDCGERRRQRVSYAARSALISALREPSSIFPKK